MRTKVISVKVKSLVSISDKAFKAEFWDGKTAILPKSVVFNMDSHSKKSEAYWIAEWLLNKNQIHYSDKRAGWFNDGTITVQLWDQTIIKKHIPKKIEKLEFINTKELER